MPHQEPTPEPEMVYRALDRRKEKDLLAEFTPEQQAEIKQKQQILSSLAYFIGKDFRMPVELNEPGAGWHWDFQENVIRIDPKDLLEKPMDYLCQSLRILNHYLAIILGKFLIKSKVYFLGDCRLKLVCNRSLL